MNEPKETENTNSRSMTTRTPFSAEMERLEQLVILKLHGDLDIDGAQILRNIFESRVQETDLFVVFDMEDVSYINSAGVGAIVAMSKASQNRCGRLFLLNLQDKIRNIFQITDLDTRLAFIDSLEKALRIICERENTEA